MMTHGLVGICIMLGINANSDLYFLTAAHLFLGGSSLTLDIESVLQDMHMSMRHHRNQW